MTGAADAGAGRRADVHRGSVREASVRVRGPRGRGLCHSGRGLETSVSLCYLFVSRAVPAWSFHVTAWSFHVTTPQTFLLTPARPAVTASSRLPTLPPEDLEAEGSSTSLQRSWALQP